MRVGVCEGRGVRDGGFDVEVTVTISEAGCVCIGADAAGKHEESKTKTLVRSMRFLTIQHIHKIGGRFVNQNCFQSLSTLNLIPRQVGGTESPCLTYLIRFLLLCRQTCFLFQKLLRSRQFDAKCRGKLIHLVRRVVPYQPVQPKNI